MEQKEIDKIKTQGQKDGLIRSAIAQLRRAEELLGYCLGERFATQDDDCFTRAQKNLQNASDLILELKQRGGQR